MRILLCDGQRLLLECIAAAFEERAHDVEQALTPSAAVEHLSHGGADVCVLDLVFPKSDGGDPVGQIRRAAPSAGIVIFAGASERDALPQARASGANGYSFKEDSLARLLEVVARVHLDGDAGQTDWDLRPATSGRSEPSPHFLTPRELQALEGLVRGKNTSDLARWMGVRESTVSTHVQTVLTKLGVHSRLEAVAFAMAKRLVTIGG